MSLLLWIAALLAGFWSSANFIGSMWVRNDLGVAGWFVAIMGAVIAIEVTARRLKRGQVRRTAA